MTKLWEGEAPPEFPADVAGWVKFRQRWHHWLTKFADQTRRLFVQTQTVDARVTVLEAAGGGGFAFEIDAGDATATYATGDLLVIDAGDATT